MKCVLISSGGGHFEQLKRLGILKFRFTKMYTITEFIPGINNRSQFGKNLLFLPRGGRENLLRYSFTYPLNAIISFFYFLYTRPDLVITTGAHTVIPFCLYAKLFSRKLIFIESYSKVDSGTLSGRFLYRFSDIFIVQSEKLLKVYPKAIFIGTIY